MADLGDPKTVLRHYLQLTRDSLIWKLDGLGERDARLPRTPTGNNLLGVLKHCPQCRSRLLRAHLRARVPDARAVGPDGGVRAGSPSRLVCPGGRDEEGADRPLPTYQGLRGPDHRAATARRPGAGAVVAARQAGR